MAGTNRRPRSRQSPNNCTVTDTTPRSPPPLNDQVTNEVGAQFIGQTLSHYTRHPRSPSSLSSASTIRPTSYGRATPSANRNAGPQVVEHPAAGPLREGPTYAEILREHIRPGSQLDREYEETQRRHLQHNQGQFHYGGAPQHPSPHQAAMHINPVATDATYVPGSRYNNLAHMTYQQPIPPCAHVHNYPVFQQHMPSPHQQNHATPNFHPTAWQTPQTSRQTNPMMPLPLNTNAQQHVIASPNLSGPQTYAQALQSPPRPPAPVLRRSTRGRSGIGDTIRTPSSRSQLRTPSHTGRQRLGPLNGRAGSRRGSLSFNNTADATMMFTRDSNTQTTNSFTSPLTPLTPTTTGLLPPTPTTVTSTTSRSRRTRQQMREGPGEFVCPDDGARFTSAGALNQHRRNHNPPKFFCPFPGCSKPEQFLVHLQRHYSTKHCPDERPFFCHFPECEFFIKGFKRKDHLTRHLRLIHDYRE